MGQSVMVLKERPTSMNKTASSILSSRFISCLLLAFVLCRSLFAIERQVVSGPLVVSESWPESTDLISWTRDVMRLEKVENASETAQAKAFFKWLRLFSKMATGGMLQAYEGAYGNEHYVLDAHKNLFVYGWGYCDTHSRIAEAAWREYKKGPGSAERVCVQHADRGYHTMYRLKLDGHFAAFDARYGYYLIDRDAADARILDWSEVGDDRNILRNKEYRHRSSPFFEYFGREWERAFLINPVYYDSEDEWVKAGSPVESVFGNGQYQVGTPFHDMSFQLYPGMVIERYWDNTARKFYVPAGFESKGEEPFLPSGRFYRVTESMFDGNWVRFDPNYAKCAPYLTTVPGNEGYNAEISGGRTIGQAWGKLTFEPRWDDPEWMRASAVESSFTQQVSSPYLRPAIRKAGGQATFDFYSPYVLVDGLLSGHWLASDADQPRVEIRTLQAKPRSRAEPDVWSEWQTLSVGPRFHASLGRSRFNGKDISVHGVYRFQIRLSISPNANRKGEVGLQSLSLDVYFENGIMSIPQIIDGVNAIHFKVTDSSKIRGPIRVVYRYQTQTADRVQEQILQPTDFHHNSAAYTFDAPGLIRCNSLLIAY
jgi:hypothetical protein